jgi:hypothetical protein
MRLVIETQKLAESIDDTRAPEKRVRSGHRIFEKNV